MTEVTIIIPVSPAHIHLLPRALASIRQQTAAADAITIFDSERRGAGWARNRGLEQTQTPLVAFLDADDELHPHFIEHTYRAYLTTQRYIYCDFIDDKNERHLAPDCAWADDGWHGVTVLVPTGWARAVGGFDETLSAGEDSDFFVKLNAAGYCGRRLAEALFTYHRTPDSRSRAFDSAAARRQFRTFLSERYKGKRMGCCGSDIQPQAQTVDAAEGMVLVRPKWDGRRTVRLAVTGRLTERVDRTTVIALDPRDAASRPDLWEILPTAPPQQERATTFKSLAAALHGVWNTPVPSVRTPPPPADSIPTDISPTAGLARVMRLSRTAYNTRATPVFVFPHTDYPSYTDVKRLIHLSGFDTARPDEISLTDAAQVYVWLSPEPPPALQAAGKHIWWTLEYGGQYEPDVSDWRGDVWASDPAWAARYGAQYVVMGSHPALKPPGWTVADKDTDYLMLAYLTPRREALKQAIRYRTYASVYPGYGRDRHAQLGSAYAMVHAHQSDFAAIAPQRFALCAAYELPLIHEAVPEMDAYRGMALFADYEDIPDTLQRLLSDNLMREMLSTRLHEWLCKEHTFADSVRKALA